MISCERTSNNSGWNGDPEELGNIDLDVGYITKQTGMDWTSLQDLNNNMNSYYSYGQKVSAIPGDYAIVNGKWYYNGSEITPENGDYAYVNENSELQMWTYDNGGWRIIEDAADEDTILVCRKEDEEQMMPLMLMCRDYYRSAFDSEWLELIQPG